MLLSTTTESANHNTDYARNSTRGLVMQDLTDALDQALDACFPNEKALMAADETMLRLNIKSSLERLKRKVNNFDP